MFNIIITNRKSTTIAPTYTIRNIRGRYSNSKKKSKQATLKNDRMRKSAECRGLLEKTSIIDEKIHRVEKKEKIIVFNIILFIVILRTYPEVGLFCRRCKGSWI
jgi:hypothetical protein